MIFYPVDEIKLGTIVHTNIFNISLRNKRIVPCTGRWYRTGTVQLYFYITSRSVFYFSFYFTYYGTEPTRYGTSNS